MSAVDIGETTKALLETSWPHSFPYPTWLVTDALQESNGAAADHRGVVGRSYGNVTATGLFWARTPTHFVR